MHIGPYKEYMQISTLSKFPNKYLQANQCSICDKHVLLHKCTFKLFSMYKCNNKLCYIKKKTKRK